MNTNTKEQTGLSMQAFDFEEAAVRTLLREGGEPWFAAVDVARVLDIQNIRQNLNRLDADEKGVCLTDTHGGEQKLTIINESGLYTLILRCDAAIKPGTTAHRFRKWVTSEVLPALRKQGAYSLAKEAEQDERAERLESVRHAGPAQRGPAARDHRRRGRLRLANSQTHHPERTMILKRTKRRTLPGWE